MQRVLVTGGAGFIGSNLVRSLLAQGQTIVLNIDKLTYAADRDTLAENARNPHHHFQQLDISDFPRLRTVFDDFKPDAVMHLAAESHVDRSIDSAAAFIDTNIVGTFRLLEAARDYWSALPPGRRELFRFHHISTDEVYGSLGPTGKFREDTPYSPNSPYSASKASSDHLVRAWHATYGLPIVLTNCSNNYGPYQFPEKLIPLTIINALLGFTLPVYGQGDNIRDWLYVEDHVQALQLVCLKGAVGETYNIGGDCERTNLDVVQQICSYIDMLRPSAQPRQALIKFVADRPGHDHRYAIDTTKIKRHLGWTPKESFESGLFKTVQWYIDNRDWWDRIRRSRYGGERLGRDSAREQGLVVQ